MKINPPLILTCLLIAVLSYAISLGYYQNIIYKDITYISHILIILFIPIPLKYSIGSIKGSLLYNYSEFYENSVSLVGLLGTMIGFFLAINSLIGQEFNASNATVILQGLVSGVNVALLTTITASILQLLINIFKFMEKDDGKI